jgi:hypothetical protein
MIIDMISAADNENLSFEAKLSKIAQR